MQEDFVTLQDVANRSNCHATTSALPGSGNSSKLFLQNIY